MSESKTVIDDAEFKAKAQNLLDAAYAFFHERRKLGLEGAVVWLKGTGGELVLFTRGEYVGQIMKNVHELPWANTFHEFEVAEESK